MENTAKYKVKIKFRFDELTHKNATAVDSQMRLAKKQIEEELWHCIFPLKMHLMVSAEIEDDNDLYVTISCPDLVTETSIDNMRLSQHLTNKFQHIGNNMDLINITIMKK